MSQDHRGDVVSLDGAKAGGAARRLRGARTLARFARTSALLCSLSMSLLGCAGGGASAPSAASPSSSPSPSAEAGEAAAQAAKAQLTKQATDWDLAIVRKDRAAIAANMAEDFRQIDGNAHLETKASFVDGVMAPALSIDPYVNEEFEIRLYGDVALLSGRTRMTGRYDGEAFTSHYRYIDIYVRRAGEWKIVSVQITRIKE